MKWGIPDNEYRLRFAFLPVKIDYQWVWLEWYDTTGWYYNSSKYYGDLIIERRYPSKLKIKEKMR